MHGAPEPMIRYNLALYSLVGWRKVEVSGASIRPDPWPRLITTQIVLCMHIHSRERKEENKIDIKYPGTRHLLIALG